MAIYRCGTCDELRDKDDEPPMLWGSDLTCPDCFDDLIALAEEETARCA